MKTPNLMDIEPVELRVKMLRVRVTQADIGRKCGVSRTMVHLVVEGKAVSDRIRRAIAEAVHDDVKKLWPSTYISKESHFKRLNK